MNKLSIVFTRFARGFIAGGVASAAVLLGQGVSLTSISDLKKFGIALLSAFLVGGLLGLDKYVRFQA